jgi:hypothetical protein
MGKPNALSRRADHGSGQGDNNNLILLAPELFRIHALAGTRLEGEEHNILCEVWRSLRDKVQEEVVAKAARELRKDKGRGMVKSAEWSESNGLWCHSLRGHKLCTTVSAPSILTLSLIPLVKIHISAIQKDL